MAMNDKYLSKPVFFVGMPRSGTTIIFESFARHASLGWLSNYSEKYPTFPYVNLLRRLHDNPVINLQAKKKQYSNAGFVNNHSVRPDEAYAFWDGNLGIDFARSSLKEVKATSQAANAVRRRISRTVWAQGRSRFASKLTGPGRIGYLGSIFPDAKFIHVVRDGRAVVHSLLRVDFWQGKGGFDGAFWSGLLDDAALEDWESHDRDPGVITAHEWNGVIDSVREETGTGKVDIMEVSYESFVEAPHESVRRLYEYCELEDSRRAHEYIDSGVKLVNMNQKYVKDWTDEYITLLTDIMREKLVEYGYLD